MVTVVAAPIKQGDLCILNSCGRNPARFRCVPAWPWYTSEQLETCVCGDHQCGIIYFPRNRHIQSIDKYICPPNATDVGVLQSDDGLPRSHSVNGHKGERIKLDAVAAVY